MTAAGPRPKYPVITAEALRTAKAAKNIPRSMNSSNITPIDTIIGAKDSKEEITKLTKNRIYDIIREAKRGYLVSYDYTSSDAHRVVINRVLTKHRCQSLMLIPCKQT